MLHVSKALSPFVPAKAGTQSNKLVVWPLGPRIRGDERIGSSARHACAQMMRL